MPFPTIDDVASVFNPKRSFLLAVTLGVILIALFAGDQIYDRYLARNWQQISSEDERDLATYMQSQYSSYELETVGVVAGIAHSQELQQALSHSSQTSQSDFFDLLFSLHLNRALTFDLYDKDKHLLCWSGDRKPIVDAGTLISETKIFIVQGAMYSYLVVITPVIANQSVVGYLVGKRLFDVNYPINNRFINNAAFTATFSSKLDKAAKFDCSSDAIANPDTSVISVALKSRDGMLLGYAFLPRTTLSNRIEQIHEGIITISNLYLFLLAVILGFQIIRWSKTERSWIISVLLFSLAIWIIRYSAIWTNISSSIFRVEIFDPKYFASSFGFGLAKSLGDVLLSTICILLNTALLFYSVEKNRPSERAASRTLGKIKRLITVVYVAAAVIIILMSMRGFSATIHSAVFDSALPYNDPTSVLPSFEVSIMLVSLLLLAVSLVLFVAGGINLAVRLVQPMFSRMPGKIITWLTIGIILVASSVIFGSGQENPLMSQGTRILYLVLFMTVAFWLNERAHSLTSRGYKSKVVAVVLVAGVLVLVPTLDNKVHELDRAHAELLAHEVMRPVDGWLTFMLNHALDELSGTEAARILSIGDSDEIDKLAFTQWAKSSLSREGNNCSVTYVNWDDAVVSDFHLGVAPHRLREHLVEGTPGKRTIHVEEKSHDGMSGKWYVGYTPVEVDKNPAIGGVWVELSASRQTLLRGKTPEILMNSSRERFETHYRKIILSEYFKGKLLTTTDESIPLSKSLLVELQNMPTSSNGIWIDHAIDGKLYETLFLPESANRSDDAWIALSMEGLDLSWHVYSFLRYTLFFLILACFISIVIIFLSWFRGQRLSVSFATRLMMAFLVMSLIPILIVAYYNRQYGREQAKEESIKRLNDQTSIFVSELQHHFEVTVPAALTQLTDERCAEIANDLNADFNVYDGMNLQASSKPEIFTADLLDQTISAGAYQNIILLKKNFFAEALTIGTLPYVVGYRPLVSQSGSIFGVVSVPALYRQTEIDEELTHRNVFLYGVYAIALLLSLVVASFLANQISSPIRRLRRATQEIAVGRMDVDLRSDRRDELGDLEEAFKTMTKDLQKTQSQMVMVQRELAWKEMAKQVAHEIKNPLTPIKLSIQHLRQAYSDRMPDFGSLLQQVSETILAQIEALSRIASQFAHFARMPDRLLVATNVHDVLTESKSLFLQHGHIQFVEIFADCQPLIIADRDELRRAFINIIRNAIQAMEERGKLTMRTSVTAETVEIGILDTGPGIPPTAREHLFEPNFSTKTDGMGLGLAIVKKIITDLGGTITIESGKVEGTLVRLCLPLAKKQNLSSECVDDA